MAWIIKNNLASLVVITDLNINLTKGQLKDLDLLGRENAERSNDIKILLAKGYISTMSKDPYVAPGVDSSVANKLMEAAQQASAAAELSKQQSATIVNQTETINKLQNEVEDQKKKTQEVLDTNKQILEAVQAFSAQFPVELKTMKKAMENIQFERALIAEKRSDLTELPKEEYSDAEIKAQERILANKDKKLEKNLLDLGKAVTKNAVENAADVDDALDAMDELGI